MDAGQLRKAEELSEADLAARDAAVIDRLYGLEDPSPAVQQAAVAVADHEGRAEDRLKDAV